MGLSAFYGTPKPDTERLALLDKLYASGEHFWDSADMYQDSEDLLGKWFKANPEKRDHIFLATKFANCVNPEDGSRYVDSSPEYARRACEKSLKRLGVERIDLCELFYLLSYLPFYLVPLYVISCQLIDDVKTKRLRPSSRRQNPRGKNRRRIEKIARRRQNQIHWSIRMQQ